MNELFKQMQEEYQAEQAIMSPEDFQAKQESETQAFLERFGNQAYTDESQKQLNAITALSMLVEANRGNQ